MSRSRTLSFVASLSLVTTLFVVLPAIGSGDGKKDKDGVYRPLGLFTEVVSLVRSNYVEPVELDPLLDGAFQGMTEAMDPFSEYVPPKRQQAFLAAERSKEKKEVVESGAVLAKRLNYPIVVSAIAGSPAAAAGLKSDDLIEKIGDQPGRGLALWEADALLAGPPGTKVSVLVVRDGKPRRKTLTIVRSSWTPEGPSTSRVEGETVLRIPSFAPGTAATVRKTLETFDATKPLLLDIRGNAAGAFEEAARTAALFVPAGPLGELKGKKIETRKFEAKEGERVHQSRLVVLMDSGTAGAAELFASALRDGGARQAGIKILPVPAPKSADAVAEEDADGVDPTPAPKPENTLNPVRLVGEPTTGMGLEQQVVRLGSGGSLKLSVGKVRSLSGRALSPRGLDPDERVFQLPPDEDSTAPPKDQILQRGLRLLAEPANAADAKKAA
ncbi:MAG: PDZ domain-containing protein [Acidobacteria bacterium]|nr:PDZ domain-containing protein [Acidobacteriota bacterium]